jgi:hypothetical protein
VSLAAWCRDERLEANAAVVIARFVRAQTYLVR